MRVGKLTIGPGRPLTIIGGPCLAKSPEICLQIAEHLQAACDRHGLQYIFKASFDKANRSAIDSDRGPGLEAGLELIGSIGRKLGVPTTTDIHETVQAGPAGKVVDLIQIPAFLARQTDLLVAAGSTGKALNVKKGQFMAPAEMSNVLDKVRVAAQKAGHPTDQVMLTERGTFFGYHRLVNDFVGLADLMAFNVPVCFDVTHSTQQPGGQGRQSGGRPDVAPLLARAAVAVGVDAIFLETHPEPARARSDGACMIPLDQTGKLLEQLARLRSIVE